MVQLFEHPGLGKVKVVVHPASRRISARWKEGFVKVTVPPCVTSREITRALDNMAPQLLAKKLPAVELKDVVLPDWSISVGTQSHRPDGVLVKFSPPQCVLECGTAIDWNSEAGNRLFNNALLAMGRKMAPVLLLPRARQLALLHGCSPALIKISHGRQVLGHCSPRGEIALSYINVFLPPELRDYVICHELAHLTHMNHSERFHKLCDTYLGGAEKQLRNRLKNYRWPVRR